MAITSSGQIDGTSVLCTLDYTISNRTSSGFTINFTHVVKMNSSGANTGSGWETYTAYITISGTGITSKTVSMEVKPKSVGMSPWETYTTTASYTISTTSTSATTANISFYIQTSADGSKTSTSSTGTASVPAGTITPTAPTISLAAKPSNNSSYYYIGYNPDNSVTITCSGGSNIAKYKYQYSIGNGWVDLTTTTSSSYTATGLPTLAAGKSLSFQVVVYSSTNNTATATSKTLYYRYRTPDAPTITSPTTKTLVDAGVALNIAWTAPVQTVSGYKLEIIIDGATTSLGTVSASTLSYTYGAGLSDGSEAYFRRAAYNDSASSSYAQSAKFTTIAVMPVMVPCYVMVNGSWQPVSINNLINNE